MYKDELGILISSVNEAGLITECSTTVALPTTANKFAIGCQMLGNDGKNYTNTGTVAIPVWQDENSISTSEIADQAVTMAKIVRGTDGQIIIAQTGASPLYAVLSGDITMTKTGLTSLKANNDWTGGVIAKISIPSGTPVNAVAAVGTITVSGTPIADETMVIGGRTYTFKAARAVAGEITIDADNAVQVTNIIAATDLDSTDVVCTDGTGNTVVVTASTKGISGNSLPFTESATGIAVNGSGTLGATVLGVAGTVGAAREVYADASYIYYTNSANSASDNNWRRISLGSAY